MNKVVYSDNELYYLTKEEIEYFIEYCKTNNLKYQYLETMPAGMQNVYKKIPRHHPALVATVEHFTETTNDYQKKICLIRSDVYYIQEFNLGDEVIKSGEEVIAEDLLEYIYLDEFIKNLTFGDKVEYRNKDDEDWEEGIFLRMGHGKNPYIVIPKDSLHYTCSKFCRHKGEGDE